MKTKKGSKSNNLKGRTIYTSYIPHGVSKHFKPVRKDPDYTDKLTKLKSDLGILDKEFVVLYNNRNIRRKNPGDVILAYKTFCEQLPKEQSDKCVLLMHTTPVDQNGTDLPDVVRNVCPDYDVKFTNMKFSTEELNLLYNISSVTVNMASNEGFGLATCESIKAGTPIVVNVTGGMQDQCGFTIDGALLTEDDYIELGSLHDNHNLPKNLDWGSWVIPVWPTNRSLQGSVPTPYIFDDRCDYRDVAVALLQWYHLGEDGRYESGIEGSKFANSPEIGMSAEHMGNKFIQSIDMILNEWKPNNEITLWQI